MDDLSLRSLLCVQQVFWEKASRVPDGVKVRRPGPLYLCAQYLGFTENYAEPVEKWKIEALQPRFHDAVGLPFGFESCGYLTLVAGGRCRSVFNRSQMMDTMLLYQEHVIRDPLAHRSDHFSREVKRVERYKLEKLRYGV